MACITKQHVGKYTYLYESQSFRDEQGRPRNKKTKIGKIDPKTGQHVYNSAYLDRMEKEGTPVRENAPGETSWTTPPIPQVVQEILASVRSYGGYYLLSSIAKETGLLSILSETFPTLWQPIFHIACFLVSTGDPLMYCADYLSQTVAEGVQRLTSQRISELFSCISSDQRHRFYSAWMKHVQEMDFIALDITSISSYSEFMQLSEWGYNRDHEDLPQINVCMLLGEGTRLPVYQTLYRGSLKDVTTLQTTLQEVSLLCPEIVPKIVMDKGFFSKKNLQAMMMQEPVKRGFSFLIAVPFTSNYAKELVEATTAIDSVEHVIQTAEGSIRGVHQLCHWPGVDPALHTFVYFNPLLAQKTKDELYGYVSQLKKMAQKEPENKKWQGEFKKYLLIEKPSSPGKSYTIRIREEVLQNKLRTCGWLVLVSNYLEDPQEAIDIYRTKDVVEKGFCRLKNTFGLNRLRVHEEERTQNKVFCGFLALILSSVIDRTMKKENLYAKYTMTQLLRKVAQIKMAVVNGEKIMQPVTKEQSTILKAFGLSDPVG